MAPPSPVAGPSAAEMPSAAASVVPIVTPFASWPAIESLTVFMSPATKPSSAAT
jgi:hypothetical protein